MCCTLVYIGYYLLIVSFLYCTLTYVFYLLLQIPFFMFMSIILLPTNLHKILKPLFDQSHVVGIATTPEEVPLTGLLGPGPGAPELGGPLSLSLRVTVKWSQPVQCWKQAKITAKNVKLTLKKHIFCAHALLRL